MVDFRGSVGDRGAPGQRLRTQGAAFAVGKANPEEPRAFALAPLLGRWDAQGCRACPIWAVHCRGDLPSSGGPAAVDRLAAGRVDHHTIDRLGGAFHWRAAAVYLVDLEPF